MNFVAFIKYVCLFWSLVQIEGCNQLCLNCYSSQSQTCQTCIPDEKIYIQGGQCMCQEGYYNDPPNLTCLPICGDGIILDGEDCDDGNYDPFDGCNKCKFGCQDSCQDCLNGHCYQCKVNYILDDSINICQINCLGDQMIGNPLCYDQNCFDHCVLCEFGICKRCDEINGWYLNGVQCQPKCGDGIIIQGQEQCDDKNNYPFDFCDQCQLSCQDYCQICSNGLCLQCIFGFKWIFKIKKCIPFCEYNNLINYDECVNSQTNKLIQLNFNCNIDCSLCVNGICIKCIIGYLLIDNQCIDICGDGIQVQAEEQNNSLDIIYPKCYHSDFICNIGCLSCSEERCVLCDIGFNLENYQCSAICGDRIVVGEEQCDDGNQIIFDGCYNCKFQCQQECLNCQFGKCLECQNGFENIEFICNESCNNSIITFNEFCDDGNLEPFDGCFNCNYSCDQQCEICSQGLCSQCFNLGWQVDLVNNKCMTICGDKIIAGDEQCDDGNELRYDGCYWCQYECQNECIKCVNGICYECNGPNWILKNNISVKMNAYLVQKEYVMSVRLQDGSQIAITNVFKNVVKIAMKIFVEMEYQIFKQQCDDGNNEIRDGCDKCILEKGFFCNYDENLISLGCIRCQDLNCLLCNIIDEQQICLDCIQGYFIDEFQQCSQCDLICFECSQNYKNCTTFNSQYSNQQNQHRCNQNLGIFNDFDFYECVSKCGNGVLDVYEQCDDSNREILDGCNEFCQLEEGYLFNLETHSLQKDPLIKVEKKYSNNNFYSLLINQNQESLNFSSLAISIEGFYILDYNYSVIENNNEID